MGARYLISNPCEDACGTLRTDRTVDGAPVYRCPGCDSEWIELDEIPPAAPDAAPAASGGPSPSAPAAHGDAALL